MSETLVDCDRFADLLLDAGNELDSPTWREHLDGCPGCRAQWHAHRYLVATFAAEPAPPELSPTFDTELDRRLASAVEVKPLRGWRLAAMWGYVVAAAALLGWTMRGVPLPTIDPSSSWVAVAALLAVPLTFWVAIGASRLLPARRIPTLL